MPIKFSRRHRSNPLKSEASATAGRYHYRASQAIGYLATRHRLILCMPSIGMALQSFSNSFMKGGSHYRSFALRCRWISPHSLQVNAYLTPESSRGLNVHYDIHDVFVMQTEGRKRWRIYDNPVPLPGKDQPFSADTCKPGKVIEEFDLDPGDLIYIPRGYMHDAESQGLTSLHLTVRNQHDYIWCSCH